MRTRKTPNTDIFHAVVIKSFPGPFFIKIIEPPITFESQIIYLLIVTKIGKFW